MDIPTTAAETAEDIERILQMDGNRLDVMLIDTIGLSPHDFEAIGKMRKILDINGLKRPNRYGRDVFLFNIDAKKGIIPYGLGYIAGQSEDKIPSRNDLMNGADWRTCKKQGLFCAGIIMLDGWEIKSDYPW